MLALPASVQKEGRVKTNLSDNQTKPKQTTIVVGISSTLGECIWLWLVNHTGQAEQERGDSVLCAHCPRRTEGLLGHRLALWVSLSLRVSAQYPPDTEVSPGRQALSVSCLHKKRGDPAG